MIDQKFQCSIFYGNFDQNSKYTLVYLVTISQVIVFKIEKYIFSTIYNFSLIPIASQINQKLIQTPITLLFKEATFALKNIFK